MEVKDLDRKFDRLLKAIKEVGFPIVLSSVLIYVGVIGGDRLLTSHESFIEEAKREQKIQANNSNKLLEGQNKLYDGQINQTKLMERQLDILENLEKLNKK
jgi:hypothetical protein